MNCAKHSSYDAIVPFLQSLDGQQLQQEVQLHQNVGDQVVLDQEGVQGCQMGEGRSESNLKIMKTILK